MDYSTIRLRDVIMFEFDIEMGDVAWKKCHSSSIALWSATHAHSCAVCHRGIDSSREDREVTGISAGERRCRCGNEARDVGGEKREGILVL